MRGRGDVLHSLRRVGHHGTALACDGGAQGTTGKKGIRGLMERESPQDASFSVLGVGFQDLAFDEATSALAEAILSPRSDGPEVLYFANAHTLNLATEDSNYRAVLNRGDRVFGDGTGVRWAARLQGREVRANLNGTDLMPALFSYMGQKHPGVLRYFLLGAEQETIEAAGRFAESSFPGCVCAGTHHGYILNGPADSVLEQIEESQANLLLVGMGNPLQETFIDAHRDRIPVALVAGVGGLFQFWSGQRPRASGWIRKLGFEWFQMMVREPARAPRYIFGNPQFLYRITRERVWK